MAKKVDPEYWAETCAAMKRLMAFHGVTQQKLAEEAGLTSRYLSRLINGREGIGLKSAVRVVEALKKVLKGQ